MEKTDRYLPATGSEKHLKDKDYIRIEDIFGYLLTFRTPFSKSTQKSVKNYRNQMVRKVCGSCTRDRSDVRNCKDCRALKLKQRMKRANHWFHTFDYP